MRLDPANPQPDERPRDFGQKSGSFIPGFISIGITLAVALLAYRFNKHSANTLPHTPIHKAEAEPKTHESIDIVTPKNPDRSLTTYPTFTYSTPSTHSQPIMIDIKSNRVDYAGLVIGFLSLLATIVIAVFAYLINVNQATSQKVQSEAARDEVNVKFIAEFRERLGELSLPDDPTNPANEQNLMRKTLAGIALAQYGERVFPALKMSLTARDPAIREGATVVLVQMLSKQADTESREKVFSKLLQSFQDDDAPMRIGILKCFVMLYRELSEEEVKRAKSIFKQHIRPDANLSEKLADQDVLIETAKFFANWPSRGSAEFLLAVAKNPFCGSDPREQALNYLPSALMKAEDLIGSDGTAFRKEVIADLEKLLPHAPERLKTNISAAITELNVQ